MSVIPFPGPAVGPAVAATAGATATGTVQSGAADSGIGKAIAILTDRVFWQRTGLLLLGLWLIWIGIGFLLVQSRAVRGAIDTAVGAATKGVI